ncbi:hypothetical protein H072_7987 [Dactylellina haptotyla CBS 200.50]|uniref:Uncharacterized protein n=1 Tax=Dactylellina haptotyla (strain CBS 200.50) TaxID=1284197 RepID=S8BGF4_DACHA|nr:hypothetical protein H072_7987 [Dactylellina haptotyla CBS 200.50]
MASLKDRARKAKTIFSLDSPTSTFLTPQWPVIAPQTASAALAAITTLLTDLEELRASSSSSDDTKPNLLVGPNPVTTHLEQLASSSIPISLTKPGNAPSASPKKPVRNLLAVFVTRSDQPSQLHSHLPFLCSISSIPLIALPKTSEQKLVKLLKPSNGRVYMIAVFSDSPGSDVIRQALYNEEGGIIVGKVDLPDVFKTSQVGWLETKHKTIETFVGQPKKKRRQDEKDDMEGVESTTAVKEDKATKKKLKKDAK